MSKWVYLTTAPDEMTAELWKGILAEEGIPAVIQPGDHFSFIGTSILPCRLLVPEELKEEATATLESQLGREL